MKEYILEALIGNENVSISFDLDDAVISQGHESIIQNILARPYLIDKEEMIVVIPSKFSLLCVYPMPVQMALVEDEGSEE